MSTSVEGEVLLRAERDGRGPGRRYSLVIEAEDEAGNRTIAETTVFVPHDRAESACIGTPLMEAPPNSRSEERR